MEAERARSGESGQAMVEAALTLPLVIFLILGTVQLFLALQARIMAEYAVFQAARVGSVRHGRCEPMLHAAVTALLPTFRRTDTPATLANAFGSVHDVTGATPAARFRFDPARDFGHDGEIAWLYRRPNLSNLRPNEEQVFDDLSGNTPVLALELIYWFPLKIPFANRVIARMALANAAIEDFTSPNPLMLTQKNANWTGSVGSGPAADRVEWRRRVIDASQFTLPIRVTAAMPFMSPPRAADFAQQHCFSAP